MHDQKGFTLIELLVVVTILATLALIVGPKLFGRADEARRAAALAQIRNIESALALYERDNGIFPTTEQGLDALVSEPGGDPSPKNWHEGGYLEKGRVPDDPWKNPYVYVSPGTNNTEFDLESYGADGEDGGEGKFADIENWDLD